MTRNKIIKLVSDKWYCNNWRHSGVIISSYFILNKYEEGQFYMIIIGLCSTWIFLIIKFYIEKTCYKQNITWSLNCVYILDCATLLHTMTCGISFSLTKVSSLFFWLVISTGNRFLIGLFNVRTLSLEITSTFADLILPSLVLISSTIFPIPQS